MECVPRLEPGNEQTPTLCASDAESAHSSPASDALHVVADSNRRLPQIPGGK